MRATTIQDWPEANQRYLSAALAAARERLEVSAARIEGDGGAISSAERRLYEAEQELDQAAEALPAPSALEALVAAFGLSPFERDMILICAGAEMDSSFRPLCAAVQGDSRRAYPSFSLAMKAFPGAHWSAILPAAPLRRWQMVEVGPGDGLTTSPLRIDERVLHHLAGLSYLDERLRRMADPICVSVELPPSYAALAGRIVEILSKDGVLANPVIQLCGGDETGKRIIAASAFSDLGLQLHAIHADDVPANVAERDGLARLWEREAVLSGTALLVDCEDLNGRDGMDRTHAVVSFVESAGCMVAVNSRQPLIFKRRSSIRLEVGRPNSSEQQALWHGALGPLAQGLDGQLEGLVAQFNLGPREIQAASIEALAGWSKEAEALDEPGEAGDSGGLAKLAPALWDACRAQARPRLEDLAQRIEPLATWDDLVLPEPQIQILREIGVHLRGRARVYDLWGFASKGSRGLGISALFAGDSGTGKTMAAEVLANDLKLDLYRIDLSQTVSKYIGETEKNLRRVFDAAENGGAILLFDEADALFGKRSEVKDSHDRYANIEISYLLQRMEAYRGLAILTTNMKSALDRAFLRRIRFIVQFPFPDAACRAEIWRRIFPEETPTDGLTFEKLARLNVAGGNIRNIALYAAFLAADSGKSVGMAHLLRAARVEYAKMERALTEGEIGGWT
jgi:hypothetical protein